MKKYLPVILFVLGLLVLVVAFIFIKNSKNKGAVTDEETTIDVPFAERPVAYLTPTSDGHYINLKIDKIKVKNVQTLDYELLYSLPDGRTQGVPGTVDLKGATSIEKKLLLGSESSGKFRYDEGVEEGSLTVRLRDAKGKLLAKYSTKFHLQSTDLDLISVDESFKYTLAKKAKGAYFITMETFGLPDSSITSVAEGPFGVFSSESKLPEGSAEGWTKAAENFFYK